MTDQEVVLPDLEHTGILLTDSSWRQRVVEKVVPLSADHYELRRSFQFEIPADLLEVGTAPIEVLLPVCWLPKTTLLEFDVSSAGNAPLVVLERKSIAGVMAELLMRWQSVITALSGVGLSQELLESICVASLDPWETVQQRALGIGRTDTDAVCDYLGAVFGPVSPKVAAKVLREGLEVTGALREVLSSELADVSANSLTMGWILAPYFVPRPSVDRLAEVIDTYYRELAATIAVGRTNDEAAAWLELVYRASVRWPLLVRLQAPIAEPVIIKTREVRGSGDPNPRKFVHQADLGAARSYHLHVRPVDDSLWIPTEPVASTPGGESVGALDVFENTQLTEELFATYTSLDPRPEQVAFEIRFALKRHGLLGYAYAYLLAVGALVVSLLAPSVDSAFAAFLTIPTTFVVALLAVRGNSLVARYHLWWRVGLVILSIALWYIAGWRALGLADAPVVSG